MLQPLVRLLNSLCQACQVCVVLTGELAQQLQVMTQQITAMHVTPGIRYLQADFPRLYDVIAVGVLSRSRLALNGSGNVVLRDVVDVGFRSLSRLALNRSGNVVLRVFLKHDGLDDSMPSSIIDIQLKSCTPRALGQTGAQARPAPVKAEQISKLVVRGKKTSAVAAEAVLADVGVRHDNHAFAADLITITASPLPSSGQGVSSQSGLHAFLRLQPGYPKP